MHNETGLSSLMRIWPLPEVFLCTSEAATWKFRSERRLSQTSGLNTDEIKLTQKYSTFLRSTGQLLKIAK